MSKNRKSVGLFPVKVNAETRKERHERIALALKAQHETMSKSILQKFIGLFNSVGKIKAWEKIVIEPEAQSPVAMAHLRHSLAKSMQ